MRIPALAILTMMAAVLTAAPARAQTYDPDYPICLQAYRRDGGYIDCSYVSLAQCAQTASGLSAQCYANPYFRSVQAAAGPHARHHRRAVQSSRSR